MATATKARKAAPRKKAASKGTACACGCGATTKGGTFRPGHDAKLKGKLLHALRNGNETGRKAAVAKAKSFGWKLG